MIGVVFGVSENNRHYWSYCYGSFWFKKALHNLFTYIYFSVGRKEIQRESLL